MGPWAEFHILGRGAGEKGEEGRGLVSKLCCNLRKSPGSVGSGKPSWGGKAPHLAEKGGALGRRVKRGGGWARRTTHHLPPTPLPWPDRDLGPQGPLSLQKESIWALEVDTHGLEGSLSPVSASGHRAQIVLSVSSPQLPVAPRSSTPPPFLFTRGAGDSAWCTVGA